MTESITATSASSEASTVITPPSKPQTQEGRILAALGLLRGPLPYAVTKWQIRYYDYLASRLCLPFDARCPEDSGVLRPWTSKVTVIARAGAVRSSREQRGGAEVQGACGAEVTEIPLIDLEVDSGHPNEQLIEDYWYWFWNWQFDPHI